ncbi:MAG: MarR family transcriptional regulator [Sphaerochaetaceae bacterium]|nr:MarR family transcriptional regulator [Spirochaetales bacterium]MDY5498645.1 MarR family transcriptional regulator [Sphaerochaetaceae bacterium]
MMDSDDALKLENQLCFPLYAASREVIRAYTPLLEKLDLTYTQYITMMVLWEKRQVSVKEIGELLFLDSGTLTPLLKKLEAKGYLTRQRNKKDERSLMVAVTDRGLRLKGQARSIPKAMTACFRLSPEEAQTLYKLLYRLIGLARKDST